VGCRPVPARFQPPSIDNVADQKQRLGVVTAKKIDEQIGLASTGSKMDIRDEQSSDPDDIAMRRPGSIRRIVEADVGGSSRRAPAANRLVSEQHRRGRGKAGKRPRCIAAGTPPEDRALPAQSCGKDKQGNGRTPPLIMRERDDEPVTGKENDCERYGMFKDIGAEFKTGEQEFHGISLGPAGGSIALCGTGEDAEAQQRDDHARRCFHGVIRLPAYAGRCDTPTPAAHYASSARCKLLRDQDNPGWWLRLDNAGRR
jgi:hypothetical protein